MNKTLKLLSVFALAAYAAGYGQNAVAAVDQGKVPMTLTGCVVPGEAKDSFVLTDVTVDGAVPSSVFYRLDTTKGLKEQVGYRVEVQGTADMEDMDKGKVEVKKEDGKTTTSITSERKTVKVPSDVWFGSMGAVDSAKITANIATYKLDVKSVRRIAGRCS